MRLWYSFDWHEMVGTIFVELIFFIATSILIDSRQRLETPPGAGCLHWACLAVSIREWAVVGLDYGLSYRPGSVAGDPNLFSASAVTVLPIMVAFAFGQNGWKRPFCGVACC